MSILTLYKIFLKQLNKCLKVGGFIKKSETLVITIRSVLPYVIKTQESLHQASAHTFLNSSRVMIILRSFHELQN
jgi:hypothetical protein